MAVPSAEERRPSFASCRLCPQGLAGGWSTSDRLDAGVPAMGVSYPAKRGSPGRDAVLPCGYLRCVPTNNWDLFSHLHEDPDETLTALSHLIPGPISGSARKVTLGAPAQLQIGYNSKGKPLVTLAPGARVDLDALVVEVERALDSEPRWVTTALAGRFRTTGALNAPTLQLRPVLDLNAPELTQAGSSNLNAILLDVVYDHPNDGLLQARRRSSRLVETANLLAVGMWPPVWLPRGPLDWVTIRPPVVPRVQNVQAQPGFWFDEGPVTDLSKPPLLEGCEPMELVPHERFVEGPVDLLATGVQYSIETLPQLHQKLLSLPASEKRKANRAFAWLAYAARTQDPSVKITCNVAGIEALLSDVPDNVCPECGQQRFSLTRRVKKFLDEYAGVALRKRFRDGIYSIRSGLVHGSHHYQVDEPAFSLFAEAHLDELKVTAASRAAALNWLAAQ